MISKPKAVMFLATGGYVGYAPFASGTFGSLVGLPIVFGLSKTSGAVALVSVIALTLGAVWVAHRAEKALNAKDPGYQTATDPADGADAPWWLGRRDGRCGRRHHGQYRFAIWNLVRDMTRKATTGRNDH
ncbi:MAG: phosphatidylglycerophosphatase A [Desulfobacteraceae bacterium]